MRYTISMATETILTTGEVAGVLGVSRAWVKCLVRRGTLKARRDPKSGWWLVKRADAEKLASTRRANPPRPGRKPKEVAKEPRKP